MKKVTLLLSLSLMAFVCQAQTKQPMQINHVALFVKNIKVSREFYTQVIGLDSVANPFRDGKHLWLNIGKGATMHIIEGANQPKEYFQNNHLCLSTTSVAEFKKTLEKRGLMFYNAQGEPGKITNRVDGVQQLWLKDPDGYWIEINDDKSGMK